MPHSSPVYPCGRCGCQAYAILSGSGKWLKDDEVGRRRNKGVKALPHCQWTVRAPAAPLAASTLRSQYDSCFQLAPTYVRTAVVLPNRILRWSYRTTYCGCYGAESCSSGSLAWSPERGMFMGDLYFSSRILASCHQAFRRARLNVLAFSLPLTLRRNFGFCAGFPSIIPSSLSCLLSPSWISPCGWFIIRSIFHVLGHLLFLPVKSKEKGTKHGQHGLSKSTTGSQNMLRALVPRHDRQAADGLWLNWSRAHGWALLRYCCFCCQQPTLHALTVETCSVRRSLDETPFIIRVFCFISVPATSSLFSSPTNLLMIFSHLLLESCSTSVYGANWPPASGV